jgi:hypothetical protein
MSAADSTETQRPRGAHWSQLVFATILNILLPNSGGAYLGLPTGKAETHWQRKQAHLVYVGLAIFLIPAIVDLELQTIALLAFGWVATGSVIAVRDCRIALKNPDSVKVQEIESNTWSGFFYIALFSFVGFEHSQLQSLTLFRASTYPPIVADAETLLGFEYSRYQIDLQRGQLVLADIDGTRRLVRIVATSGDIYVPGENSFQLNGRLIPLPPQNRTDTSVLTSALWDLAQLMNYPNDWRYSAPAELGKEKVLANIRESETIVVPRENYLVAQDHDLIDFRPKLPVTLVHDLKVLAVPRGKLWTLGDSPGSSSELAQPEIIFRD